MSEELLLPSWAYQVVSEISAASDDFSITMAAYNAEQDKQKKSIILATVLSKFAKVERLLCQWKFITKSTSLDSLKKDLQKERMQFVLDGFKVEEIATKRTVNILFVDTETTGIGKSDQPISVGAVLVEADIESGVISRNVASYYGLRSPSCEISSGAYAVHGMDKHSLEGKEFDLVELISMFGVAELVVAHNAKFDRRMLSFVDGNGKHEWGCSCWDIDWPSEIGGRSLDAICANFRIPRPEIHNAMADVESMIGALQKRSISGKTYLFDLLKTKKLS